MPLDSLFSSPVERYWYLKRVNDWELKFCLFPKRCCLSNKKLFGKFAYKGLCWITGPGDPIPEVFWIDKNEFLIWQIKRDH